MAMKNFAPVLLVALALLAFAAPSHAARNLLTDSCDDHCKLNKALLTAHIRGNYLSCARHGVPLDKAYCGNNDGAVRGCQKIVLDVEAEGYADALLVNVKAEILSLRAALGVNVAVLPIIDIKVFIGKVLSAAINVDVTTFNCYGGVKEFYLTAFILADLDVNIKVSIKYLLKIQAYIDVVVKVLPTCQDDLAIIQAKLLVFADIVLVAGLKIRAIVDLCIKYLDCGLCSVLGISLGVILGPVLGLVNLLLGINLTALLAVFVKLVAIVNLCIVAVV